jgi:hypothetical protein
MFQFNLKTHRVNAEYKKPHFFILNRGNNSGKPLAEPCPNCFVCLCESEADKNSLYWIVYGLWQGRGFEQFFTGSVITFVHLKDFKKAISFACERFNGDQDELSKKITTIQTIQLNYDNIQKQLALMQQLRRVVVQNLIQ